MAARRLVWLHAGVLETIPWDAENHATIIPGIGDTLRFEGRDSSQRLVVVGETPVTNTHEAVIPLQRLPN